jgi:hypothetical protein
MILFLPPSPADMHTRKHVFTNTYAYARTHTDKHEHICLRARARAHTHTHTTYICTVVLASGILNLYMYGSARVRNPRLN